MSIRQVWTNRFGGSDSTTSPSMIGPDTPNSCMPVPAVVTKELPACRSDCTNPP
jgi:hypothetical protein